MSGGRNEPLLDEDLALDHVFAGEAPVLHAVGTVQVVEAGAALQQVATGIAEEAVLGVTARQVVGAVAAGDGVEALIALDDVAPLTVEAIVAGVVGGTISPRCASTTALRRARESLEVSASTTTAPI